MPKKKRYIIQYADYMEEVKKRTDVCDRILIQNKLGKTISGYRESDIDLLYLQIRKIFELIMFASVASHKFNSAKMKKVADTAYSAGRLVQFIKSINPDFFPSPKVEGELKDGIRHLKDLPNPDEKIYLSEQEMKKIYNKVCGDFSHAKRRYHYGNEAAKNRHFIEVTNIIKKIRALLNHHWVKLDEKISLAVIMKSEKDGKVHVAVLVKLEE